MIGIPLSYEKACEFYSRHIFCGIYKITNIINQHCYIGQSVNIRKRWINHKASSLDYPLYRAFKKYGIENFTFEILEECKRTELDDREKYYINFFNSYKNGYNQTLLCKSYGHPQVLSNDKLLDLFDDLMYTNLTKEELSNKYKCSERTIRDINSGRSWYTDNIEYPIRKYWVGKDNKKYPCKNKDNIYTNPDDFLNHCIICGKIIPTKNAKTCQECHNISQRKIKIRPNKNELIELIAKNGFLKVGKMFNVSDNTIRKWCKGYNIPYKSKEFKKYYLKEMFEKIEEEF